MPLLSSQISDQLKSRFSSGLSLPQICENFIKAAYDPRISGIYLHIEPLNCGWGKVEEIYRHIVDFKKSGKAVRHLRTSVLFEWCCSEFFTEMKWEQILDFVIFYRI